MLNGQWIGEFDGDVKGTLIIDIDDDGEFHLADVFANSNNGSIPSLTTGFITARGVRDFQFDNLALEVVDPRSNTVDINRELAKSFPAGSVPSSVKLSGEVTADSLTLNWQTNLGDKCFAVLSRSKSTEPSAYKPSRISWEEFKNSVARFEGRRFLFRGQSCPMRLRTAFHRTGRANLTRFRLDDIPALHRHLSCRTKHLFNLNAPDELGSFLNLAQHHGYPTPMLDWTYSPYVAAFFAYRRVRPEDAANSDDCVRILVFDQKAWRRLPQPSHLSSPRPYFSVIEPLAIDNERMLPQQAVMTVTNVDDIESYISQCEGLTGLTYLTMYDLPIAQRDEVMAELSFMGITAGSMFPGIDGACEELRERHFRKW